MPAKLDLTWEPGPRRWRKQYMGRQYTVSARQLNRPETKEGSYQAANEWWERNCTFRLNVYVMRPD